MGYCRIATSINPTMTNPFTHDYEGRPRQGCKAIVYSSSMGLHLWEEGEIDAWEYPAGVKGGNVAGDRTDTCRRCGLQVRVLVGKVVDKKPSIANLAKSCKDVAFSIDGEHPYSVADRLEQALGYPDLAYEIKKHIYDNTGPKTVMWHLPEPRS